MKRSEFNLENLLNQLSEEKINRVVDSNMLRAAWGDDENCHSEKSNGCEKSAEAPPASGGSSSGGGTSLSGSGSVGISVGAGASGGLGLGF